MSFKYTNTCKNVLLFYDGKGKDYVLGGGQSVILEEDLPDLGLITKEKIESETKRIKNIRRIKEVE